MDRSGSGSSSMCAELHCCGSYKGQTWAYNGHLAVTIGRPGHALACGTRTRTVRGKEAAFGGCIARNDLIIVSKCWAYQGTQKSAEIWQNSGIPGQTNKFQPLVCILRIHLTGYSCVRVSTCVSIQLVWWACRDNYGSRCGRWTNH